MSGTEPWASQLLLCLTEANNIRVGFHTITKEELSISHFFCFYLNSHFPRHPLKRHLNPCHCHTWSKASLCASAPSNLPCRDCVIRMGDAQGEHPLAPIPRLWGLRPHPAHNKCIPAPGHARRGQAAPKAAGSRRSIQQGLDRGLRCKHQQSRCLEAGERGTETRPRGTGPAAGWVPGATASLRFCCTARWALTAPSRGKPSELETALICRW